MSLPLKLALPYSFIRLKHLLRGRTEINQSSVRLRSLLGETLRWAAFPDGRLVLKVHSYFILGLPLAINFGHQHAGLLNALCILIEQWKKSTMVANSKGG